MTASQRLRAAIGLSDAERVGAAAAYFAGFRDGAAGLPFDPEMAAVIDACCVAHGYPTDWLRRLPAVTDETER